MLLVFDVRGSRAYGHVSQVICMSIKLANLYRIYMLQVNLFLRSICFQPRSICFNLGQFDFFFFFFFFFLLLRQTKKIFLAPSIFSLSSFFSSSPLYLPHLLFPPCSPNIPTCILFISMLTLGVLNHRPLVFLWIHVLMPYHWAMQTWMQVPLFF